MRMSVMSSTPVFFVFTMGSSALKLILYLGSAMVPLNVAVAFSVPSSFSSSGMSVLNLPSGSLLIVAVPLSSELLWMVSMRLLSSSQRWGVKGNWMSVVMSCWVFSLRVLLMLSCLFLVLSAAFSDILLMPRLSPLSMASSWMFPLMSGVCGVPFMLSVVWSVPRIFRWLAAGISSVIRLIFRVSVSMLMSHGVVWAKNFLLLSMLMLNGILPLMLAISSPFRLTCEDGILISDPSQRSDAVANSSSWETVRFLMFSDCGQLYSVLRLSVVGMMFC